MRLYCEKLLARLLPDTDWSGIDASRFHFRSESGLLRILFEQEQEWLSSRTAQERVILQSRHQWFEDYFADESPAEDPAYQSMESPG